MIYVIPPMYEHDDYRDIEKFNYLESAIAFIKEDLKKNEDSTFTNTIDCYTVIEGYEIKIKDVECPSKSTNKYYGNPIMSKYDYPLVYSSPEERDIFEGWKK